MPPFLLVLTSTEPAMLDLQPRILQILYTSTAAWSLSTGELTELLRECRTNNKQQDVTGMLLYRGGRFLQVIEGEMAVVESLYRKIRDDDRHVRIKALMQKRVARRQFSQWTMSFTEAGSLDVNSLSGYSAFLSSRNNIRQLRRLTRQPSVAYEALLYFKAGGL